MTEAQHTQAIIDHRRYVKAHDAFAALMAGNQLTTVEQCRDYCDTLRYGKSVLDTLARITRRSTFSHSTAEVLRLMILDYSAQLSLLSK